MPRSTSVLVAALSATALAATLVVGGGSAAAASPASALTSGGGCDNPTSYAGGVRGYACISVDSRGVMQSDGYFYGPAGCVVYAQAYENGSSPVGAAGPTTKLVGGTTSVHVPSKGDNSATGAVRGHVYKSRVRFQCSSSNVSTPSASNSQVY